MTRAWPATPLLLIVLSILIAGAGGWAYFRPVVALAALPVPTETARSQDEASEDTKIILPMPSADSSRLASDVLSRSPFSPGRAAFSRAAPSRQAPAKPEYSPQFVGLLGKGKKTRAMVTWNPGEQAQIHAIGDETPWGKLVSATSSELLFEGNEGQKVLKLF